MKKYLFSLFLQIILIPGFLFSQWMQTTGPCGGDITSFAVRGKNLFAGTASSGVFRSTNSGQSWKQVNKGMIGGWVSSFLNYKNYLFAGTYDGVYFSTNNGISWNNNASVHPDVSSLAASGTNIFAGSSSGTVYISRDCGASWDLVNNGLENDDIYSFAVNSEKIYAGTEFGGVYFSTDNGTKAQDWRMLSYGDLLLMGAISMREHRAMESGCGNYLKYWPMARE